jgi:hypothetical protein
VQNLLGTLAEVPVTDSISRVAEWSLFFLQARGGPNELLPPDTIVNRVVSAEVPQTSTVRAPNGFLAFTPAEEGIMLYATVVVAPQAFSFPVTVEAPGQTIGIYVDETLIRSGVGKVTARINATNKLTPLNIVTVGSPVEVNITLPSDISAVIRRFAPSIPKWRRNIPIETNYVDPKSGGTGNALFWYDDPKAGGWNVYRVSVDNYGIAGSVQRSDAQYLVRSNATTQPPVFAQAQILTDSGVSFLGTISDVQYSDEVYSGMSPLIENAPLMVRVDAATEFVNVDDVVSGTLQIVRFNALAGLPKVGGTPDDNTITFVDVNVEAGVEYSYSLDAYAAFDPSLRSEKSRVETVTAGDVTPPDAITVNETTVVAGQLYVSYVTPTDTDYAGCHVYYDNVSSGTLDSLLVDYGNPDTVDSLNFPLIYSGTYYFLSFDKVGNEQITASGESYLWDGVGGSVTPQPPVVQIRQLTSSETVTDGYSPSIVARFELDAYDPDTAHDSLEVHYRRAEDGDWVVVVGISLPTRVNVNRENKDNWLRTRAYDGALYSDELTFVVDYDTAPEISSVYGRFLLDSGSVFVTGAVDDDAQSIKWFITGDYTGPIGSDPTEVAPATINNLILGKTFSFSFVLSDGQKKLVHMVPYSLDSGTGDYGPAVTREFVRPPRTLVFFAERSPLGGVRRTDSLVTLIPVPSTARVFKKIDPISYGTITSVTATTLTDTIKNWTVDGYNTYYEVSIVSGPDEGDVQTITDTTSDTVTVAGWATATPNVGDKYHIRERFREYADNGTVTASGNTTLTDSSKTWIPNAFKNKIVECITGANAGEQRTVLSNTLTQLTISEAWTVNPSADDKYKIEGAMTIVKSADKDKVVSFYADVPGIATEETRSIVIDSDSIPEIGAMTLSEPNAGQLTISLTTPDDDVKTWQAFARKDDWPTIDLTEDGTTDTEFLRFSETYMTQTVSTHVSSGDWYIIVTPFDSFNNSGPSLSDSITILDAASDDPALTKLGASVDDSLTNRIWYEHNAIAETGSGTTCYVTITALRSDYPPEAEETVVSVGDAQEIWEEYDATTLGLGSSSHTVFRGTKWASWVYTIKIYKNDFSTLIDTYNTSHSGYYEDTVPE